MPSQSLIPIQDPKVTRSILVNSQPEKISAVRVVNDSLEIQESSVFSSKVPNCKDLRIENEELPGPGAYNPDQSQLLRK